MWCAHVGQCQAVQFAHDLVRHLTRALKMRPCRRRVNATPRLHGLAGDPLPAAIEEERRIERLCDRSRIVLRTELRQASLCGQAPHHRRNVVLDEREMFENLGDGPAVR